MKYTYDILGVGLGPFNLGLAALCQPIRNLKTAFVDQKPFFNWHEGMLIPGTTLQVPYLADLVTLADPRSAFTYLNYLKKHQRLLRFGIHEQAYITRNEYNNYCKWVAGSLSNLYFNRKAIKIAYIEEKGMFEVTCLNVLTGRKELFKAKKIVMGTGSRPSVPSAIKPRLNDEVFHSSRYLQVKPTLNNRRHVVIVGSGQSAAEIFYDLLEDANLSQTKISWHTRNDRFFPMEQTKFAYEMASPDYIDFFYQLDLAKKHQLLPLQQSLYKGINHNLLNSIHDRLYEMQSEGAAPHIHIQAHSELENLSQKPDSTYELKFYHNALKRHFKINADAIILATGYKCCIDSSLFAFPDRWKNLVREPLLVNRNYSLDDQNLIFIQHAELHTHGFNAADLSLGPYRNAVIINTILESEFYPVEKNTCFQHFGIPGDVAASKARYP
ncbi:lysine N(6)-hydroxylase/L-ornithine N(5)-oxygenase family protein [Niabella insulamsoli]|uniref:lysine N(6)-hydroxylase/L-ornithine N(5)-oxygenase family protein n=1 Tax=Niabella insulamsoli TaxID=3144874 RepID=UPI0031FBA9D3